MMSENDLQERAYAIQQQQAMNIYPDVQGSMQNCLNLDPYRGNLNMAIQAGLGNIASRPQNYQSLLQPITSDLDMKINAARNKQKEVRKKFQLLNYKGGKNA